MIRFLLLRAIEPQGFHGAPRTGIDPIAIGRVIGTTATRVAGGALLEATKPIQTKDAIDGKRSRGGRER